MCAEAALQLTAKGHLPEEGGRPVHERCLDKQLSRAHLFRASAQASTLASCQGSTPDTSALQSSAEVSFLCWQHLLISFHFKY